MANRDHVDQLQQGVLAWNQWRSQHPEIVPDLSEEDLAYSCFQGVDFSRTNLHNTDLRYARMNLGANLHEADLSGAILICVDLHSALIERANLRDANLQQANLYDAFLRDANLSGADLSDADIRRANLTRANLDNAIVKRARFDDAEGLEKGEMADLRARGALFQGPPTRWEEKYRW